MRSDNLSTISSQPSSACTIKTSTSSSTSGWSLATSSRQWPTAGANHNNNNNLNLNSAPLPQKALINSNKNNKSTTGGSHLATSHDRQYSCAGNKFHRAAIDGYVDMLCEASKRDTNTHAPDDFLQLTPTLLAAQSGQLEALRILVGRGGDPERVSALGSSALHLAAARNHLNCVSFLVNFGANMWALDNELRTAKDTAALCQSQQVLEYLDQMMAKQSAINTKLVQKLKDKAKGAAEKRLKQMRKQQLKAIKQVERDERLLAKLSSDRRLLKSAHSMSDIKLVGRSEHTSSSAAERLAAISFSPNDPLATRADYRKAFERTTKVTNLLSQRFRCTPSAANDDKMAHSDLDSSYCSSSSVSSASGGHLSSCSGRSILKSTLALRRAPSGGALNVQPPPPSGQLNIGAKSPPPSRHHQAQRRPKFSDLVAVGQSSSTVQSSGDVKLESLLGSRLRGLGGGVSRRVHLKRLLFASSQAEEDGIARKQRSATTSSPHGTTTCKRRITQSPKLCQVSPVSRLKMSMGERAPRAADNIIARSCGPLKRTRSEPDFGSVMRNKEDEEDEEDEDDEDLDDSQSEECRASENHAQEDKRLNIPAPPPEPPGLASPAAPVDQFETPPPPPQQLLTRCLSQLRMKQHQQNVKQNQQLPVEPNASHPIRPTGAAGQLSTTSNSDELIRHQLSASEFPLRPSIIKQQLHMRHQQQQQQQDERRRKSTTIMSVDSIGSAGSFVQRNTDRATSHSHQLQASDCNASSSSSALSSASFDGSGLGSSNSGKLDDAENMTQNDQIAQFLASNNLLDLTSVLAQERIDLEALLLLSEADLKSLNILLGPRRKLLNAIGQYKTKQQLKTRTKPRTFTVVDTQF